MDLISESLCQEEQLLLWSRLAAKVFRLISYSELLLPAILTLIVAPLLLRHLPYRRWLSGTGAVMLALYIMAAFPKVTELGNRVLLKGLPEGSDAPAQAIVVLGRGSALRNQRVEDAAALWRAGRAPLIFLSGRGDTPKMAAQLQNQHGIPAEAIAGEPCSRTTEENALLSAELLLPGTRRIILVTDAAHLVRSHLTFASLGFDIIDDYPSTLPGWMGRRQRSMLQLREYMGLVSYGLMGRYFPRSLPEHDLLRSA